MAKTMCSPVRGYVTSEFGKRNGVLHAGMDIGTGGVAAPVYATFAGRLSNIVRGRRRWQPASEGAVVASGRSGDGGRVKNSDGEQQVYIHVGFLAKWKNGDKVRQGELLGYVNLSGQTTGYHLHYEEWTIHGTLRNPRASFQFYRITPGSIPKRYVPPSKYPYLAMNEKNTLEQIYDAYSALLTKIGYKVPSGIRVLDKRIALMQVWLKDQGYYKGLIDGVAGPMTKRALQSRLSDKGLRRPYKGPLDGLMRGVGSGTRIAASALLNDRRNLFELAA